MRKAIIFFILILAITLVFSGCSGAKISKTGDTGMSRSEFRRPDFGQPERRPDLTGIVKSIIGNETTIIKIERPVREGEQGGESTEDGRPAVNPMAGMSGGSGGAPGMGHGFSGGARPSMDENSRAAMLEQIKEMSSGEETVLIPVGIRMLKPDTTESDGQPSMLEASLSDIKSDKMINIWLDENISDRKIAEFVLIMR